MPKTHHIIFTEDLDGIVSAAIFLHNHVSGERYRLYPIRPMRRSDFISYVNQLNLKKEEDRLIILNYQDHPDSDFWTDYHYTSKIGHNEVRNGKMIYNPFAKCTSELVYSITPTKKVTSFSDAFLNIIREISKAEFRSAYKVFNDTHPVMILRAFLERRVPEKMMYCRIVEMLRQTHFDFKKAIYQLGIGTHTLKKIREDAESIKKKLTIFGNCSLINQTKPLQYPKYSEFFVNPNIKYSIRITPKNNDSVHIQIGFNKWCKESNEVNIGQFLSSLNYIITGGGHFNLAACVIYSKDIERFLDDISIHLNKEDRMEEEPEMEKNAVDRENDSFEVEAQEKVASGKEENIIEARKSILNSDTDKEGSADNAADKDK